MSVPDMMAEEVTRRRVKGAEARSQRRRLAGDEVGQESGRAVDETDAASNGIGADSRALREVCAGSWVMGAQLV